MLYDTRWDQNTETKVMKNEPLSLASLIAWLETMPLEQKYNYADCKGNCLIGQYLTSIGSDMKSYWIMSTVTLYRGSPGYVAATLPHTFGAALTRARAIMEQGA